MSQDLTNTPDIPSNSFPNNLTLHRYRRKNQSYTEDLGNDVKLTLMLIPSGEFLMGAPETEPEMWESEQQHPVQISQFLMGRYPVTREQWRVGNVWEWCTDDWHGDYTGSPSDGIT